MLSDAFAIETQSALDALAYAFARDLKASFERRGQAVDGRPPTLIVGELVLNIDIAGRKAQWLYGKEALTRPIALSINTILQPYDAQRKAIVERKLDAPTFLAELYKAWQYLHEERTQKGQPAQPGPSQRLRNLQPAGHESPVTALLECARAQHLQRLRTSTLRA